MTRSVLATVDFILPLIPGCEPLGQKLQDWRDGVFLELPETNAHLWREAAIILHEHFPVYGPLTKWQSHVALIWTATGFEASDHIYRTVEYPVA